MSNELNTTATVPASPAETLPDLEDGSTRDTPDYYCLLTNAGAALEAQAHAAGKPVRLTHVAVGDGGGDVPTPGVEAAALLGETYRKAIDSLTHDENDPNIVWIQMVIPADVGGFWIREFGVYAEPLEGGEPVLYAYGNHAPYYKLKRMLGQATTHELSIPLIMSGTAEVEIVISEAGYASRSELLRHVEASQQREIKSAREFITLSDRVTKLELAQISGVLDVSQAVVSGDACDCGELTEDFVELTEEIADFREELAEVDLVEEFEEALNEPNNEDDTPGEGSGNVSAS